MDAAKCTKLESQGRRVEKSGRKKDKEEKKQVGLIEATRLLDDDLNGHFFRTFNMIGSQ